MDILAYVCIAVTFLFVVSRLLTYAYKHKKTPNEEDLEEILLDVVNRKR